MYQHRVCVKIGEDFKVVTADQAHKMLLEQGATYVGPKPHGVDVGDAQPIETATNYTKNDLEKRGSGWYRLPNGETKRGLGKALKRLQELNDEAHG